MNKFENKIYQYIKQHKLLSAGEHIVLGVSGGADSLCLFKVLFELRQLLNLTFTVVHVNHGLRGQSADDDEAFVRELCREYEVACICFKGNVARMADEHSLSEEEAGREFRYRCFEEVLKQENADLIAVAHHQDDVAETVLMNVFRGSGLTGLGGIRPRRGHLIRPLLDVSRSEIEAYLMEQNLSWRTDETNLQMDYTRNRVRLDIMKTAEQYINPMAAKHLARMAELMRDTEDYIARQTDGVFELLADQEEDEVRIDISRFMQQDKVIQREIIRKALLSVCGRMKDITMTQIEDVRLLAENKSGRELHLPYRMIARKSYDSLVICRKKEETDVENAYEDRLLKVPGAYAFGTDGKILSLSLIQGDKNPVFPKKRYTKWLDYDKIGVELVLRHRQQGDYMILSDGSRKMLRRILMDDKIPKDERDELFLLAEGNHVLWLIGTDRISHTVRITENTIHILCAEIGEN